MRKYKDLTSYQKEQICNGCGGKGGIVTPPHAVFFETSCNHHDFGYWKGFTDTHRKICDKKLRAAMVKDCNRLPWHKQLRYRPWCELYYLGVRAVGWKFFHYGYEVRDPDNLF